MPQTIHDLSFETIWSRLPVNDLVSVYIGFVCIHCIIEYACPVWHGNKLFNLVNYTTYICSYKMKYDYIMTEQGVYRRCIHSEDYVSHILNAFSVLGETLRSTKGIAFHWLPEWPLEISTTRCMQCVDRARLRRAIWIWTIRAFRSEAISNRYTYGMITGNVWLLLSDGQPFPCVVLILC